MIHTHVYTVNQKMPALQPKWLQRYIVETTVNLILRQVQQEKLVQLIHQWQLRFLGHILRKPEDELANKYALYHPRHGKRKVGYPKTLFHQYIARVMCQDNPPTPEEIWLMALDRTNWGKLVADCGAVG